MAQLGLSGPVNASLGEEENKGPRRGGRGGGGTQAMGIHTPFYMVWGRNDLRSRIPHDLPVRPRQFPVRCRVRWLLLQSCLPGRLQVSWGEGQTDTDRINSTIKSNPVLSLTYVRARRPLWKEYPIRAFPPRSGVHRLVVHPP